MSSPISLSTHLPRNVAGERATVQNLVGEVEKRLSEKNVLNARGLSVLDALNRDLESGPFTPERFGATRYRLGEIVGEAWDNVSCGWTLSVSLCCAGSPFRRS